MSVPTLYPVAPGRCQCCGRTTPIWTPAAIIEALQAWTEAHGRAPSTVDWRKAHKGHPSQDQVIEVFGSFDTARECAGLEFASRASRGTWTRQLVVDAFFRWQFLHGRLPTSYEWQSTLRDDMWPATSTVQRLFGTWNGAVVAAGYTPTHARRSKKGYRAVSAQVTKHAKASVAA